MSNAEAEWSAWAPTTKSARMRRGPESPDCDRHRPAYPRKAFAAVRQTPSDSVQSIPIRAQPRKASTASAPRPGAAPIEAAEPHGQPQGVGTPGGVRGSTVRDRGCGCAKRSSLDPVPKTAQQRDASGGESELSMHELHAPVFRVTSILPVTGASEPPLRPTGPGGSSPQPKRQGWPG